MPQWLRLIPVPSEDQSLVPRVPVSAAQGTPDPLDSLGIRTHVDIPPPHRNTHMCN